MKVAQINGAGAKIKTFAQRGARDKNRTCAAIVKVAQINSTGAKIKIFTQCGVRDKNRACAAIVKVAQLTLRCWDHLNNYIPKFIKFKGFQ